MACADAGAPFVAPDYSKQVWLGPLIAEGHKRVYGVRHAETESWSGWSFIADDQPKPAPAEIRFEHLRHLVSIREDLVPYLGLPVGWTFAMFDDGSWHSWSPKERLLKWLDDFVAGTETTDESATAIAELIAEQFDGTELRNRVVEPLLVWAARGGDPPDDLTSLLTWASDWLRATDTR